MKSYIKLLIPYFFRHTPSDKLRLSVFRRLAQSADDKEVDDVLYQVWNEQQLSSERTEATKAYRQFAQQIGLQAPPTERKRMMLRSLVRMAAVWMLCLLVGGGAVYGYLQVTSGLGTTDYRRVYADVAMQEPCVLPDGTKVWLNGGSLLIYPDGFRSAKRQVFLSGEAFFEVTSNKEQPFVVESNHLSAQVLGTSFTIADFPESKEVFATLETGALQVDIEETQERFLLSPNEQLTYLPGTKTARQQSVEASAFSEWRHGNLFFNNIPLVEVLRQLERIYKVRIHLQNNSYRDELIRVRLHKESDLHAVFRILQALVPPMQYTIRGDEVYVQ